MVLSVVAPTPAVSPGRATGVTFGAIGAALGFGVASFFIFAYTHFIYYLFLSYYYYAILSAFAVVGGFWYGTLRLSEKTATRTWLEAWGAGFVTYTTLSFIIAYIEYNRELQYGFDYRFEFLRGMLVGLPINAVVAASGALIGVSIATGFARWRLFRPLPLGLSFAQMMGLTFGIVFLVFILLGLLEVFPLLYWFYYLTLPILIATAIALPFIARGMAMRRLRAARPDLFVAPPAAGNSVF